MNDLTGAILPDAGEDPTTRMRAALLAQASTLDAMFAELADQAFTTMKHTPMWAHPHLRLALRAQSNYRAALETIARVDRAARAGSDDDGK